MTLKKSMNLSCSKKFFNNPSGHYILSGIPVKALVLVLLFGILSSGCAALRSLREIGSWKKKPAAEPKTVYSRMDSLWNEEMPVDTVLLSKRKEEGMSGYRGIKNKRGGTGYVDLADNLAMPGYRVQLASAESSEELEPMLPKIRREMQTEAYLEFHGDRYTVRIGDFLNKDEAEIEKKRAVSFGYKHAWIVQTKVTPR